MPKRKDESEVDKNAYGKRSRVRAKLRYIVKRGARIERRVFSGPLPNDTAFLPWPRVKGPELGDFAARTAWYLGTWSRTSDLGDAEVAVPSYLDSSIDVIGSERIITSSTPVHHLVWKVTPTTLLRAMLRPTRYTIVDPNLAKSADSDGYREVGERIRLSFPEGFAAPAPPRRTAGGNDLSDRSALVLGTGPSAKELVGDHEDWTYRIVCNSAIRDAALMERLRPTHICFGDPVFHAGPSAYAGAFRADLREVTERYDSVLVVPSYCAPVLAANMPWARGRMLPVELVNQEAWGIPSDHSLVVRNTGNVLTQQMLPLAVALASHIDIGGADGRKPEERYFWAHSKQHQYSDELMRSAFAAHPAFFRDTDYADYYQAHCDAMESLVRHAEASGCSIKTVTTSYIPALAARMDA